MSLYVINIQAGGEMKAKYLTLVTIFSFISSVSMAVGRAPTGYWKCGYQGAEMECRHTPPNDPGCTPMMQYRDYYSSWQQEKSDADDQALHDCQSASMVECEFIECFQKD